MSGTSLCTGDIVRSGKLQNESFPNFSIFRPEFCPGFCSEFSPNFSRTFRASFRGRRRPEKIHQKSPPFFNAKFPGKHEKNIHKILLESRQSKILHLRNPNLGLNSGKRILDAFSTLFSFKRKSPPEKFALKIAPLEGHLGDKMIHRPAPVRNFSSPPQRKDFGGRYCFPGFYRVFVSTTGLESSSMRPDKSSKRFSFSGGSVLFLLP